MAALTGAERKSRWVASAALTAGLAASFFLNPMHPLGGRKICGFLILTGLPCPTCGMTRSVCCISQGLFGESLNFHPLGFLVYLIAIAWLVWLSAELIAGKRFPSVMPKRKWIVVAAACVLLLSIWMTRLYEIIHDDPTVFRGSIVYRVFAARE